MSWTIGSIIAFIAAAAAYLFPAIIAAARSHRNTGAIFVLNFFTAWTVVGWIACLVWAFTNPATDPAQKPPIQRPAFPVAPAPAPAGPGNFRVLGVERESGFEVAQYVLVQSVSNARTKVELQGVIVTDVQRVAV